jgi:P-type Ca2+ transporter type 2C
LSAGGGWLRTTGTEEETHPPGRHREAWHTRSIEEVARLLATDPERGLGDDAAQERLARYGPNRLAEARGRPALSILLVQFRSLVVLLLFLASSVAFVLGERLEAGAIAAVIALNALIGFSTEWRAERALAALHKHVVALAHVIRDGRDRELPASELVPGDLVVLAAGGRVPADGRIVDAARLQIDEAALTGESEPVLKSPDALALPNTPLADRLGMAFMGTQVTDGRGRLLVTETAASTEIGRIGTLIVSTIERGTPLEQKLARLGRLLVFIVLGLCAFITTAGVIAGHPFWSILEVGIALAVAAVPEGLPAMATIALALGTERMARLRAIVRRLPAVETLGATTVICTDKTGTLTRNEMTVRVLALDRGRVEVTGSGYAPAGEFLVEGRHIDPAADETISLALRIGCLCNDAGVARSGGRTKVLGDPTEAALLVLAEKGGVDRAALARDHVRLRERPFDARARRMVTVHRAPGDVLLAFVKGAPGTVLAASRFLFSGEGVRPLTADDRLRIEAWNEELAGNALRVLALAYRVIPEGYEDEDLERDLVFVALAGMSDPLREEAVVAVERCREAGVRAIMLTGDQQATATEIARQLGLDRDPSGRSLEIVHASRLGDLDAAGLRQVVSRAAVFARVSPEHKLRIVEALQESGEIVAMTGDGLNDAPALKQADIGIAMGIKGTEAAREAADIIITDDNFATIVKAVEQGRVIYANIHRFIHYLFSCNLSEIIVLSVPILAGWPLPLTALQILWLNLVTDVFPALALALEPSRDDIMRRPPRDPRAELVTPRFLGLITVQSLLLAAVTLAAFTIGLGWHGTSGEGLRRAGTMTFMTLALAQLTHAFNVRSATRSALGGRLFTNAGLWFAVGSCVVLQVAAVAVPPLRELMHTVAPGWRDAVVIAVCALLPVPVVELAKVAGRRAARRAKKS